MTLMTGSTLGASELLCTMSLLVRVGHEVSSSVVFSTANPGFWFSNSPQGDNMECPRWLVVSMLAAACRVTAHAADTKPHVLLVLADDLGTPSIRFREGTRL